MKIKKIFFTGVLLVSSVVGGEAIANCGGAGWPQVTNLIASVTNGGATLGRTACSLVGQGTQEEHHANGDLWDYKLGNGHAVDPRIKVGTWTVTGDGTAAAAITYNYIDGGQFGPFKVYINAGTSDVCNGSNSVGTFTYPVTTGTTRVCP